MKQKSYTTRRSGKSAAIQEKTRSSDTHVSEAEADDWTEDSSDHSPDQSIEENEIEPHPEELSSISSLEQDSHSAAIQAIPAITLEPGKEISPISYDPLRRYMDELRHYGLLSPEKEYELAIKLRDEGDLDAAKLLVSANLRLVVKIAFEYRALYSNVMDLIQEGNIGLMKAVSKFDPTKGARLGYYASWWIRSYILKYLLDNFRLVRVGTTQAQKKLFYHLMKEKEKLEAQGLLAGPKLLAEKLNVKEKEVIEMEQRLSGRGTEMSLDSPMDPSNNKSASHLDLLADPHEGADHTLEREQMLKMLKMQLPEFRALLNDKELRILDDRLLADDPKTLQEIADHYGLTRERTRQIEAKVIEKLREFLKPSL